MSILVSALALGAPVAAETIGTASSVHPEVTGGGSALKSGASVSQGEVLKSDPNGSAKISFTDGTSMSMGSSAQMTLSHFVFADKKNFKKAGFDLAKGAFRFATGNSEKNAYEVKTPTSTLSVRGTLVDITVDGKSTKYTVWEGSAKVTRNSDGKSVIVKKGKSVNDSDASFDDDDGSGQNGQNSHPSSGVPPYNPPNRCPPGGSPTNCGTPPCCL